MGKGRSYLRVPFVVLVGFCGGAALGFAARSLAALDSAAICLLSAWVLIFGAGACAITSFFKAERAHERQIAACAGLPTPMLRRVK